MAETQRPGLPAWMHRSTLEEYRARQAEDSILLLPGWPQNTDEIYFGRGVELTCVHEDFEEEGEPTYAFEAYASPERGARERAYLSTDDWDEALAFVKHHGRLEALS